MLTENGFTPEDDNRQLQKAENQTSEHLALTSLLQPDIWHHSSTLKQLYHLVTCRGLSKITFALQTSALL